MKRFALDPSEGPTAFVEFIDRPRDGTIVAIKLGPDPETPTSVVRLDEAEFERVVQSGVRTLDIEPLPET